MGYQIAFGIMAILIFCAAGALEALLFFASSDHILSKWLLKASPIVGLGFGAFALVIVLVAFSQFMVSTKSLVEPHDEANKPLKKLQRLGLDLAKEELFDLPQDEYDARLDEWFKRKYGGRKLPAAPASTLTHHVDLREN
jgi:hypothetical protein